MPPSNIRSDAPRIRLAMRSCEAGRAIPSHRPPQMRIGAADLNEALPGVVFPTRLEQPAYSRLMAWFVSERIIPEPPEQFFHSARIAGRPRRIAAGVGNRNHESRPLIGGKFLHRMERVGGSSISPRGGAAERKLRHSIRVPNCQFERDHAAERQPDDICALPADSVHQSRRIVRIVTHRIGLVRLRRPAEPALILGEDVKGFRER